ncbi:MAG TPA: HD domain-containing protein [Solirubrobacterales bacterium]|nr:HD domain-containing protein [Solirubrobacterales bacterium]
MATESARLPEMTETSPLVARAYSYARAAHEGPASRGETRISHPVAVARILAAAGSDEEVVAAALLHDVVEDTAHGRDDIFERFPDRVGDLVDVMTEDASISDYAERKAEHRRRVLDAGEVPAAIYLADKLARVRRYAADDEPVAPARLEHYQRTVAQFGTEDPRLPFLDELMAELPALRPADQRS